MNYCLYFDTPEMQIIRMSYLLLWCICIITISLAEDSDTESGTSVFALAEDGSSIVEYSGSPPIIGRPIGVIAEEASGVFESGENGNSGDSEE